MVLAMAQQSAGLPVTRADALTTGLVLAAAPASSDNDLKKTGRPGRLGHRAGPHA